MTDNVTAAHELKEQLTEVIEYGNHPTRKGESPEFHTNVNRLKADGHYQCWICGATDNLQTHHGIVEWSLWDAVDPDKVKNTGLIFDWYGYSRVLQNQPITSADDIRNLVVLCETCHIASITGVHSTTMPAWLSQRLAKQGVIIVPRDHNASEAASGNPTLDTGGDTTNDNQK